MRKTLLALLFGLIAWSAHATDKKLIISRDDVVRGWLVKCWATDTGSIMELWQVRDSALAANTEAKIYTLRKTVPYSVGWFFQGGAYDRWDMCGMLTKLIVSPGREETTADFTTKHLAHDLRSFLLLERTHRKVNLLYEAAGNRFIPIITERSYKVPNYGFLVCVTGFAFVFTARWIRRHENVDEESEFTVILAAVGFILATSGSFFGTIQSVPNFGVSLLLCLASLPICLWWFLRKKKMLAVPTTAG